LGIKVELTIAVPGAILHFCVFLYLYKHLSILDCAIKILPKKSTEKKDYEKRGRQQPLLKSSSSEVKPRLDGLRVGRPTPLKEGGTFLMRSPTKNPHPANTGRTTTCLSSLS
jgi:hypothetical protein